MSYIDSPFCLKQNLELLLLAVCRFAGQVGYVAMGIQSPAEVITGDVFYKGDVKPAVEDYVEPPKPMV